MFGVLVFAFAAAMTCILLFDASVMLIYGYEHTLSQDVSDWTGMATSGEIWLLSFIGSSCFLGGMLVTHFTQFRMEPRKDS